MSLISLLSRLTNQKSDPLMHHPPQPDPRAAAIPDFIEPLVGWRAWKVWEPPSGFNSCPALSSVILDTPWTPRRKFTAEHSFDLGAKCCGLLESGCSCGIYAFKDVGPAFAYLMKIRDGLPGMSVEVALGTVNLWGRVIDCERGYKAQYAYPRHIYLPTTISRFMPQIGSAFGVAIGLYASTCQEEIRITVSPDYDSQQKGILLLRRSGSLRPVRIPCEVGFYDLQPSPALMSQLSAARSKAPPPAAGSQ